MDGILPLMTELEGDCSDETGRIPLIQVVRSDSETSAGMSSLQDSVAFFARMCRIQFSFVSVLGIRLEHGEFIETRDSQRYS